MYPQPSQQPGFGVPGSFAAGPAMGGPGGPGNGRGGPAGPGPAPSKRVLNRMQAGTLIFAILTGLLVAAYINGTETKTIFVVRSAKTISALQEISSLSLEVVAVTPSALEPQTISGTDPVSLLNQANKLLAGKKATQSIFEHTQLRSVMFGQGITLARPLAADERLISITATPGKSVAGTIRTGDHVDIYMIAKSGKQVVNTLATNVEIVSATVSEDQLTAIGQGQSQATKAPVATQGDLIPSVVVAPALYVVRVKVAQAREFALANSLTTLYLVLRGDDATDLPAAGPMDINQLVCGSIDPNGVIAPDPKCGSVS